MRDGAVRRPAEDPPTANTPDADDPPLQTTGREAGGIVTRMTTAIPDETVDGIMTEVGLSERFVVRCSPHQKVHKNVPYRKRRHQLSLFVP